MALEDRNPAAGTQLAANYRKVRYACEVVQTEEGLRFRLRDFTKTETGYRYTPGEHVDFKMPSAAGSAVIGGQACHGWRFWSLASELDQPKEPRPPREPQVPRERTSRAGRAKPEGEAPVRTVRVIARMDDQNGTPAGQVRYWCTACADAFTVPASVTPQGCPKGHAAGAPNCELQAVEPEAPEVERVADPFEGDGSEAAAD